MKIKLPPKITCQRCGYIWTPRKAEVRRCPKCGSVYFDRPKKQTEGSI